MRSTTLALSHDEVETQRPRSWYISKQEHFISPVTRHTLFKFHRTTTVVADISRATISQCICDVGEVQCLLHIYFL